MTPINPRTRVHARALRLGLLAVLPLVALGGGAAPAWAKRPNAPDTFELGRDSRGEPCLATRYWDDPAVTDHFSDSYAITCRGATANRYLGVIRAVRGADLAKVEAALQCGAPSDASLAEVGVVRARRCFDSLLGFQTIETVVTRGGRHFSLSVIPSAQGPGEEALRLLTGASKVNPDRNRTAAPAIELAALAPAPVETGMNTLAADSESALQQGLRLIRQGLHMEASRALNDAISRLPADAPVAERIELLLVAGLADSNLRFFDSAENYFSRADTLLAENANLPGAEVLVRKRRSYGALDLLNRRNFANAVEALDRLASAPMDPGQPLTDPTTVRMINQMMSGRARNGLVATPDIASLSQLVIDAQANWARSVALLAQNDKPGAIAALDAADRSIAALKGEQIDQQQVAWLVARVQRQRARLLAQDKRYPEALAALDMAVANLEGAGSEAATFGPSLAETRLERAGMAAQAGRPRDEVMAEFDKAVDALVSSNAAGSLLPPALEQYLDLLVAESRRTRSAEAAEKFFRAIQSVGDPAVARQFVQLQSVITANGALAAKVQDRDEVEREITKLRYQIAAIPNDQPDLAKTLDERRESLEGRLVQIDGELQANSSFSAVDDSPVSVADIAKVLRPGEAFFKLTEVRNYAFGILIDGNGAQIYRVARNNATLDALANRTRASIDGGDDKLPIFDVGAARALFQLVAGPVENRMLAAKSLIVDPSGPLERLPLGVLVTDQASVDSFKTTRARDPYDYTQTNFLSRRLTLSSALSPRSLLVSRGLPESNAPLPFMGFAEHMPVPMAGQAGGSLVSVGSGCQVELETIAMLSRELAPIDKSELVRAGNALGLRETPMLTDAAFSDTEVLKRTDLNQFQVLHFATHGLTEGQWGCAKSPPALVTSMGDAGSDGILSFSEIARLRLDANLVVLSACETASGVSQAEARAAGQEEAGNTLEGLVRAFLAANARAVLTTYWPISDEGESEALIEDFYRAARQGTIGDALRSAQLGIMNERVSSHPIYWGAFFVVGDANKQLISGQAQAQLLGGSPPAAATR
ncbi:MAG: CHAT domain-containing protein [Novosphingobium sp.]|nr:CHAT domain-containing protein [Novosphingobium sp.]